MNILTPHFSAAASYTDSTHCRHMGMDIMNYFCALAGDDFVPVSFSFAMVRKRIIFGRKGRLGFHAWANRHARFYEQRFALLLPTLEVSFILRVLKKCPLLFLSDTSPAP